MRQKFGEGGNVKVVIFRETQSEPVFFGKPTLLQEVVLVGYEFFDEV